ncbi:hypothetical protein [Streptomyces sp. NPDC001635]
MWRLQCPECAAPEIERGRLDENGYADETSRGDAAAVTVHPDKDGYGSPLGTRGGYVEINLWCAAGHNFSLVVANHKGAEYVGVVTG